MSMKDKFKNFFYLDEEEEEVMTQPTPQKRQASPKPIPQSTPQPVQQQARPKKTMKERKVITTTDSPVQNNVVSLQAATSSKLSASKVILVEPRVYAEAQDIAEHLKNKRAIIVNLQRIEREQGIRIIDFLSGTVYALGGDIQRVGKDIFLCAPDNVEVSGEISNYLLEDH